MTMIITKYRPPTNTKGARIEAKTLSGRKVTLPWDHALDALGNARLAAKACQEKYDLMEGPWSWSADFGYNYTFMGHRPCATVERL